jgi:hypothetical protein
MARHRSQTLNKWLAKVVASESNIPRSTNQRRVGTLDRLGLSTIRWCPPLGPSQQLHYINFYDELENEVARIKWQAVKWL